MKNNYLQFIGWLGMVIILLAYFLMTFSFIGAQSVIYQVMNVIGSVGIIVVTWKRKDYQPMMLNIIWSLIAIIALVKLIIS